MLDIVFLSHPSVLAFQFNFERALVQGFQTGTLNRYGNLSAVIIERSLIGGPGCD